MRGLFLFVCAILFYTPSYQVVHAQTEIRLRQSGSSVLAPATAASRALPYAELANAAYGNRDVPGWQRLETSDQLLSQTYGNEVARVARNSGLSAQVYRSESGEVVLAFEGSTRNKLDPDWIATNIPNVLGLPTTQYRLAPVLANLVADRYGRPISLTGHSLGGGLAQQASAETGFNAVTFNAAGLSWTSRSLRLGDQIININNSADPVSDVSFTYQIGTQYRIDGPASADPHEMAPMLSLLRQTAQRGTPGQPVNWAAVRFAQDNMAAVISGNLSETGVAGGSVVAGARSQITLNGLFSRGSVVAETEWLLTQGTSGNIAQGESFGSITRPDSAIIYSLNNAGQVVTAIEKRFVIGDRNAVISLEGFANFVTTEFPEFVGTQFNDTARIQVITQSGRSGQIAIQGLFGAAVNDDLFSPVQGLPAPLSGQNPNNGGGQTGFRYVAIDNLNLAAGSSVTLRVEVANVGDTAFPSAILLSRVGVQ